MKVAITVGTIKSFGSKLSAVEPGGAGKCDLKNMTHSFVSAVAEGDKPCLARTCL
jgi:hypothetical protein